ncbi:MAG: hypothetical protein A4E42_02343 [Methanoregulaceae archaeon PtaU1.Bin222]|nr:MAG: hypothetical protein A4E42_02343 [Methanoregulaceae archaeon PtaU1.Bin222]
MLKIRKSIPRRLQISSASLMSSVFVMLLGRTRASTLSPPTARQHMVAATAESIPPERPITIPLLPLLQYACLISCSILPRAHPESISILSYAPSPLVF